MPNDYICEIPMSEKKKITLRDWKALPPAEQKLLFYQAIKENGEWQSITVPAVLEEEFNELITKYENEKGLPLKVFEKWYGERWR